MVRERTLRKLFSGKRFSKKTDFTTEAQRGRAATRREKAGLTTKGTKITKLRKFF
jgi:hypothetical protein